MAHMTHEPTAKGKWAGMPRHNLLFILDVDCGIDETFACKHEKRAELYSVIRAARQHSNRIHAGILGLHMSYSLNS